MIFKSQQSSWPAQSDKGCWQHLPSSECIGNPGYKEEHSKHFRSPRYFIQLTEIKLKLSDHLDNHCHRHSSPRHGRNETPESRNCSIGLLVLQDDSILVPEAVMLDSSFYPLERSDPWHDRNSDKPIHFCTDHWYRNVLLQSRTAFQQKELWKHFKSSFLHM